MKNYKKEHVRHLQVYKQFDKRQQMCFKNTKCGVLTWHWQGANVPCFSLKKMHWHGGTSYRLPCLRRLDWPGTWTINHHYAQHLCVSTTYVHTPECAESLQQTMNMMGNIGMYMGTVPWPVAYPGILFGGGGSTNSVEDRGQRERGSGGSSP